MEKQTFDGLNVRPEILEVLSGLHFAVPTPIQRQAIPVATQGKDVIGIAQTGTGKTLAFGIPAIQRLLSSGGTALIILPTRELAIQVDESLGRIARNFNLRSAVLIGGQNMNKQIHDLKAGPRIIVSTPGRLIDHLERKTLRLDRVSILILDEADRMLDMGFAPQVERIMREVPKNRQTMLFSATMPAEILNLANHHMKTPLRVEVAPAGSTADNVTHEIFFVKETSKSTLLENILKEQEKSVLIFSRTKFGAKRIAFAVRKMGHASTEIHSNRTLSQRMAALSGFKHGKYKVMVATDIAARGIDVKGIGLVINYDLPACPEDYVHRIGRTGRAEDFGHAISFATPRQAHEVRAIERLIKKQLPVSKLPHDIDSLAAAANKSMADDKKHPYKQTQNGSTDEHDKKRSFGFNKNRGGKPGHISEGKRKRNGRKSSAGKSNFYDNLGFDGIFESSGRKIRGES